MTSDDIDEYLRHLPDVPGNWCLMVDQIKDARDEIDRLMQRVAELERPPEQWDVVSRRDGHVIGACPVCRSEFSIGEYDECK